jgi:hypothetical protein
MKNLSQDRQSLILDLNLGPSEYKARMFNSATIMLKYQFLSEISQEIKGYKKFKFRTKYKQKY